MWYAQINFSRFGVADLQELLEPNLEAVDSGRRLGEQRARFADRQTWTLFVQNVEAVGHA